MKTLYERMKTLRNLAIIGAIIAIIVMPIVLVLLEMSNFSGTLEKTQLGFNGAYIKSKFELMSNYEIFLFILANIFDYLFMFAYGAFFFSTALLLTRNFARDSIWSKIGYCIAILGIISACCDGLENVFLLSMASDSIGFPIWLGIPHSCFAFAKFTLMYIVFGWLIISFVSRLVLRKQE